MSYSSSNPSLVLIGPGNVGSGVLEQLALNGNISGYNHITVVDDGGVVSRLKRAEELLGLLQAKREAKERGLHLDSVIGGVPFKYEDFGNYFSDGDIIVNVLPTKFVASGGGQHASVRYDEAALSHGAHVVAAHKSAFGGNGYYRDLMNIAFSNGVFYVPAGALMGPTRAAEFLQHLRSYGSLSVVKVEGVLNGTTNYILSNMFEGMSFEDALGEAKTNKIAEPDPTDDIRGYDALSKAMVIPIMFQNLKGSEVYGINDSRSRLSTQDSHLIKGRENLGIEGITTKLLEKLKRKGQTIKLIGSYDASSGLVVVGPQVLNLDHPLSGLKGTTNMLVLKLEGTVQLDNILRNLYGNHNVFTERYGKTDRYTISIHYSALDLSGKIQKEGFKTIYTYDRKNNQITISGPGAGDSNTAAGLLGAVDKIRSTPDWLKSSLAKRNAQPSLADYH